MNRRYKYEKKFQDKGNVNKTVKSKPGVVKTSDMPLFAFMTVGSVLLLLVRESC